jgi:hypothetical protein
MADEMARIQELEKELDRVFWNLLIPLRDEKRVDGVLYGKFLASLDELVGLVKDKRDVRKRVVSFLYLVYEVLLAESRQSKRPEEIQKEARRLQERLEKLWDEI